MSTDIQPDFVTGQPPDPEQLDETLWAREAIRDGLKYLDATLNRLVTLSTALLGGAAALFGQTPAPPAFKALAVVCFMAALGAALWGVLPATRPLNPSLPDACRLQRERVQA